MIAIANVPDIYFDLLIDWPVGTILALLIGFAAICIAVVVLLIVVALICELLKAIDTGSKNIRKGTGKVVSKAFTPAKTGKVSASTDIWSIRVSVDERLADITVDKRTYDDIAVGDYILAQFVSGLLSGKLYILMVSPLPKPA